MTDTPPKIDTEQVIEIIEIIMTQHWDIGACQCWVCQSGRAAGCRPRSVYLPHANLENSRPYVDVELVKQL